MDQPRMSAWREHPHTKSGIAKLKIDDLKHVQNADAKYKFISLDLMLGPNMVKHERGTYSLLEWLGDVGGLFDALKIIGHWLVVPFASYALKTELVSSIFS
mmetsp:Transcript_16052/g.20333  ORF Transcript_16052/g.20333 Transcript_16052/m.20333 type:complete len:101 (-) Transcript_16052:837-1139(-)